MITPRYIIGFSGHRSLNGPQGVKAAIHAALQELKRQGFQPTRDIVVLFTGDEETAMHGARRAAGEWKPLIDAEYGLNFDGGGGSVYKDGRAEGFYLQVAEKTYADYKLVATNRGGHTQRAPDNAIYACRPLKGRHARFERDQRGTRGSFEKDAATIRVNMASWSSVPRRSQGRETATSRALDIARPHPCVATMLYGATLRTRFPSARKPSECRIFPGVKIETAATLKSVSPD